MLIAIPYRETEIGSNDYGKKMISHIYDTEADKNIPISPDTFEVFLKKNKQFCYNMLLDEYVVIKESE